MVPHQQHLYVLGSELHPQDCADHNYSCLYLSEHWGLREVELIHRCPGKSIQKVFIRRLRLIFC